MLVTLTEQPIPETLLEPHGLKSLYFPIVDMNVPSCRATEDLCSLVELALERGEVIAFHCKAGLGRTGTLLVSYLIWEGAPPAEALAVARTIEPGWVQSDIQEQYLFQFAEYCRSRRPPYQS
jgi:atypical dual specificity phosphatase